MSILKKFFEYFYSLDCLCSDDYQPEDTSEDQNTANRLSRNYLDLKTLLESQGYGCHVHEDSPPLYAIIDPFKIEDPNADLLVMRVDQEAMENQYTELKTFAEDYAKNNGYYAKIGTPTAAAGGVFLVPIELSQLERTVQDCPANTK